MRNSNDMDLEVFLLKNEAFNKSQTINLNSQSLLIEHNCTDENNCTFTRHSPKKDRQGVYFITHTHKDYGKVDLSHLHKYSRVYSLSHYDFKEGKQGNNMKNTAAFSDSRSNDGHMMDKYEAKAIESGKGKSVKVQLRDSDQSRQHLASNDIVMLNENTDNNQLTDKESIKLKAHKKTRLRNDMNSNEKDNQCNNIKPMSSFNSKESGIVNDSKVYNDMLEENLNPKVNKPNPLRDSSKTNNSFNVQELVSKYKTMLANSNKAQYSKTNREEMHDFINMNSKRRRFQLPVLDRINKEKDVYHYNSNHKRDLTISINDLNCQKVSCDLNAPHFQWWLYYNSIIYPSNSIEELKIKINKSSYFQ